MDENYDYDDNDDEVFFNKHFFFRIFIIESPI